MNDKLWGRLIQCTAQTLTVRAKNTSKPLPYGKFSGGKQSTLEDFALAEWSPTEELSSPVYPYSASALELLKSIPKVFIEEEIEQIVNVYLQNRLMPNDPLGDALHLALASYHKCDYLLTWNCKHLANPNKFKQIRWCNQSLDLYVPILVTPNQLIGD